MSSDMASLFKPRNQGADSSSDQSNSDSQTSLIKTKVFELKPNRAQTLMPGTDDPDLNAIPEEKSQDDDEQSI